MVLQKGLQTMVRKLASNSSSSPYTSWLLTPFLFKASLCFTDPDFSTAFNLTKFYLLFLSKKPNSIQKLIPNVSILFLISGKIIEEL